MALSEPFLKMNACLKEMTDDMIRRYRLQELWADLPPERFYGHMGVEKMRKGGDPAFFDKVVNMILGDVTIMRGDLIVEVLRAADFEWNPSAEVDPKTRPEQGMRRYVALCLAYVIVGRLHGWYAPRFVPP